MFGGNLNNSSKGLKALFITNTSGNALKIPAKHRKKNSTKSPPTDLLILFLFLLRRCTLIVLISAKGRESIRLARLALRRAFFIFF